MIYFVLHICDIWLFIEKEIHCIDEGAVCPPHQIFVCVLDVIFKWFEPVDIALRLNTNTSEIIKQHKSF